MIANIYYTSIPSTGSRKRPAERRKMKTPIIQLLQALAESSRERKETESSRERALERKL